MMQQQQPPIMIRNPPSAVPSPPPPPQSYKIAIIVLGSCGYFFWIVSVAVCMNLGLGSIMYSPRIAGIIIIILNFIYIFYTSEVIYIINSATFPSPGELRDLRRSLSTLTSATIAGFGVFCACTGWFATYGDKEGSTRYHTDANGANFGCSFSALWNIALVAMIGLYWEKCTRYMAAPRPFVLTTPPIAGMQPVASTSTAAPPHLFQQQQHVSSNPNLNPLQAQSADRSVSPTPSNSTISDHKELMNGS